MLFGYTPGSMTQRRLNNVVKNIYGKIWTTFDQSTKKILEAMPKVNVGNRSKIGDVQHDIESIMHNTNANFQSHCRWNSAAHYSSSDEEDIEDTDINDDFWPSSVIHSYDSNEDDEDDCSEGEGADNEDSDNESSEKTVMIKILTMKMLMMKVMIVRSPARALLRLSAILASARVHASR